MNKNVQKLYNIAQKQTRRIIGLMAGTSLDGLDVALCNISGAGTNTKIEIEHFETVDFTPSVKDEITTIFAKKNIDFQHLTLLNAWIGQFHANIVLDCLRKWNISPNDIDIIASHGQTVFHAPKILHQIKKFSNATLQIGDGDHIALATGIITLSDFRQRHVAAGGEGAPLAVYGDFFIFSSSKENRILLNMGGIANFTYLPKTCDATQVFVTDTGTGNTLIDSFTRFYFPEKYFDKDAEIASKGNVLPNFLAALKANTFFDAPIPKTTGPELFSRNYVFEAAERVGLDLNTPSVSADVLATLTRFSAETIAEALQKILPPNEAFTIYMSGGGIHNPLLVKWLQELLPFCRFDKTDSLGINGDAKEAVLFAILANECLAGGTTYFGNRAGVPSVTMGKISFPN